tara:strand:+ start:5449 stop:5736 length:288 start_codon:yes stop_codon:yes gene_type:complete
MNSYEENLSVYATGAALARIAGNHPKDQVSKVAKFWLDDPDAELTTNDQRIVQLGIADVGRTLRHLRARGIPIKTRHVANVGYLYYLDNYTGAKV